MRACKSSYCDTTMLWNECSIVNAAQKPAAARIMKTPASRYGLVFRPGPSSVLNDGGVLLLELGRSTGRLAVASSASVEAGLGRDSVSGAPRVNSFEERPLTGAEGTAGTALTLAVADGSAVALSAPASWAGGVEGCTTRASCASL